MSSSKRAELTSDRVTRFLFPVPVVAMPFTRSRPSFAPWTMVQQADKSKIKIVFMVVVVVQWIDCLTGRRGSGIVRWKGPMF